MATVRDAIALAESGRADAARQAFARHVADGAPQAHKSYAIFLQQRGESDAASDDPVEEVELGKRSSAPTKASSLPAASNLPPAERPSSDDDDAGSAEEWEARDGGGFELRINS